MGVLLLVGSGCFRLDAVLYNPDTSITEYRFNDYDADRWNFQVPPEMVVADSMIHLMTLMSQGDGEAAPTKIYAAYVGSLSEIATDTVILYCHGNGSHMDGYWQRVSLLANLGWKHRYGVMLMDYRGYGLSEGRPTEAGLYADVEACQRFLQEMGLTGDRLVMYGYSMGTAPAVKLSAHPQVMRPGWLVTEAPFASAEQMVQTSTGLAMPGSFVTNLQINNAEEIKSVDQPYLLLHGTDDDYLDYETHGLAVWENYGGAQGRLVAVEGAGHGDVPKVMGLDNYRGEMLKFLRGE